MENLKVSLRNCYGIQSLEYDFDFSSPAKKPKTRAYAIYAPNGLMKTSFSRTFEALSKGDVPREERYNRAATYVVEADGVVIAPDQIHVLKAEIDTSENSKAITNILVSPDKNPDMTNY
jgi:predicted alternative tryptophan synthase beta-subunit